MLFSTVAPGGFVILAALQGLSSVIDLPVEITCACEGHLPTDPHTRGEAYDIRTLTWTLAELKLAKSWLRHTLGDAFTVLYEVPSWPADAAWRDVVDLVNQNATAPHLHVQVKKNTSYPPEASHA